MVMKQPFFTTALLAMLALSPSVFGGGNAPSPAGTSDNGELFVNRTPSELLPGWLQIGGQIRGRFEGPSGTSLANGSGDNYYASRLRVNLGIQPFRWLKFFTQAQDARVAGYNLPVAPTTLYDPLDLRQAYMQISSEDKWGV